MEIKLKIQDGKHGIKKDNQILSNQEVILKDVMKKINNLTKNKKEKK